MSFVSKSTIFYLCFFASFLEKLMVCFLILYFKHDFKYFHFTWSSRTFSLKSLFKVSEMNFFHLVNIFFVFNLAATNLQIPLPLLLSLFLQYENVISEWSVKMEARTLVFLTETCMEFRDMLLSKSICFSFGVSYSPNVTQIKLFFKLRL